MLCTININYLLCDKLSEIIRGEELKSNYCDSCPIFLNFGASQKIARQRFPVDSPANVWLKLNKHENIWFELTRVCVYVNTYKFVKLSKSSNKSFGRKSNRFLDISNNVRCVKPRNVSLCRDDKWFDERSLVVEEKLKQLNKIK